MQLSALYDYLVSCSSPYAPGVLKLRSFSWEQVAKSANVDPLEDTTAFRALIQKGAMRREGRPNTYGDVDYLLIVPQNRDAFNEALRTVGMSVPR